MFNSNVISNPFTIDYRSLALFRMGLGALVIADTIHRSSDLYTHYTDAGVLPRHYLLKYLIREGALSLYLVSGDFWFQLLLAIMTILSALCLSFGVKTRIANLMTWVLVISVQDRHPGLLQGGDILLRLLLFWAFFLPTHARWSFDSFRIQQNRTDTFLGIQGAALMLQVAFVYFFSALLKSGLPWADGSAVGYALEIDYLATEFGIWLRQFPEFLRFSTHFVYHFELVGPFLLFSPFFRPYLRTLMVLMLVGMHIAFRLTMEIGLFPYIDFVSLLIFIPSEVLNVLSANSRFGLVHRYLEKGKIQIQKMNTYLPEYKVSSLDWYHYYRVQGVAGFALLSVIWWNLATINATDYPPMSKLIRLAHLDQMWSMFSPKPHTEDGWYVISGKLRDETKVDVLNNKLGEPSFDKPALVSATYKNQRWRKYHENLWSKQYHRYRLPYGQYLCREWNRDSVFEKQLVSFKIYFVLELTLAPGDIAPPKPVNIWSHRCF